MNTKWGIGRPRKHTLPAPLADNYDWQLHAACRGMEPRLFFPQHHDDDQIQRETRAKTVCRRCPVRSTCLTHALTAGETDGIWGGLTTTERHQVTHQPTPTSYSAAEHTPRPARDHHDQSGRP